MSIFKWLRPKQIPLSDDIQDSELGPLVHVSPEVWEGTSFPICNRVVEIEVQGNADGPEPLLRNLLIEFRANCDHYAKLIDEAFANAEVAPLYDAPLIVSYISASLDRQGIPYLEVSHYPDNEIEDHLYTVSIQNGQVTDVWR